MRSFITAAAAAIAVIAAAPAGALVPANGPGVKAANAVTPVAYYHRRHYYRRGGWVPPYLRGFGDPGYAYHGNINGCAVDLG